MSNKSISADATNVPLNSILDQYRKRTDDDIELVAGETYELIDDALPMTTISSGYSLETIDKTTDTEKTVNAVVKVIEQYNRDYNLALPTKLDDIKELIQCIATREQRDLYVVVLSEAADRIILGTVTSALITVSSLMGQLTSDQAIAIMTLEQKVGIMDRLLIYLEKLLEIQKTLGIDNPRLAMKNALRNNEDSRSGTRERMDVEKIDQIIAAIKNRS
jgi:hypothetical protein